MSRKSFLVVLAGLALSFGLAGLVAPAPFWGFYGLEVTGGAALLGRLFGAALLAWGLILLVSRHFDDYAQETILIATAIADAAGAAIAVVAIVTGVLNAQGWSLAGLYLLCAMGCAYVLTPQERRVYATQTSFIGPIA